MLCSALFFRHSLALINSFKIYLLRSFGAEVGNGVLIKPSVHIKFPWKLRIGNHVWIGEKVWIDNLDQVVIGDHCCISQGAMLLCGNHNYKKTTFDLMTSPITLEDGVWVGARSLVCPGVRCGSHAVLAVQSVATKDLEAYTIYQGNPAAPKKARAIR
jgi:putative colanic acid biosynthesis acetyltransferase WcaF